MAIKPAATFLASVHAFLLPLRSRRGESKGMATGRTPWQLVAMYRLLVLAAATLAQLGCIAIVVLAATAVTPEGVTRPPAGRSRQGLLTPVSCRAHIR
jgi:hypothetical protein